MIKLSQNYHFLLLNKKYCILNLDKSYEPGSHWVGVCHRKGGSVIYDSFGRSSLKIIPSLYKSHNGRIIDTKRDAEQSVKENNCGERACSWLILCDLFGVDMGLLI